MRYFLSPRGLGTKHPNRKHDGLSISQQPHDCCNKAISPTTECVAHRDRLWQAGLLTRYQRSPWRCMSTELCEVRVLCQSLTLLGQHICKRPWDWQNLSAPLVDKDEVLEVTDIRQFPIVQAALVPGTNEIGMARDRVDKLLTHSLDHSPCSENTKAADHSHG